MKKYLKYGIIIILLYLINMTSVKAISNTLRPYILLYGNGVRHDLAGWTGNNTTIDYKKTYYVGPYNNGSHINFTFAFSESEIAPNTYVKTIVALCVSQSYSGNFTTSTPSNVMVFRQTKTNSTCKRRDGASIDGVIYKIEYVTKSIEHYMREFDGYVFGYTFGLNIGPSPASSIYLDINNFTHLIYDPNNEAIKDGMQDINDNITNDKIDSSGAEGFFNNFDNNDHGLSSIITAPLNFIKNLNNATCTPIKFNLLKKDYELPCMSTEVYSKFPELFLIYRIILFGLVSYWIGIDIYRMVKGFKDPNNDKVEVLDL